MFSTEMSPYVCDLWCGMQCMFREPTFLPMLQFLKVLNSKIKFTTRRDIAMLGVLHRAAVGKGPAHFREHFKVVGQRQLEDPRTRFKSPMVRRSILGPVAVYNALPLDVKLTSEVKTFQALAQALVKRRLFLGRDDWKETLSPRVALKVHPLTSP